MIFSSYYKFKKVVDRKTRFELISSNENYEIFETTLINKRNPNKNGFSINYGDVPENFNASSKRKADKILSKTGNISSVFIPDISLLIGFGDVQNPVTKVKTKDALIILFNPDYTEFEIFIALNQKNNRLALYHEVISDEYKDEFEQLKKQSKELKNDIAFDN